MTQIPESNLTDALRSFQRDIELSMNCIKIGIIESFNPTVQTATIRIVFKQVVEENDQGERILRETPLLVDCPVVFLGGGGSSLTFPIAQGDTCIVLFADRDIDAWFRSGNIEAPTSGRAHDLSDGIAIVGVRSLQNLLTGFFETGVELAFNSANKIQVTNGTIDTTTPEFTQNGDMTVTEDTTVEGNLFVVGDIRGDGGGAITTDVDIVQAAGRTISVGDGATGVFTNSITVVDGIVKSGF